MSRENTEEDYANHLEQPEIDLVHEKQIEKIQLDVPDVIEKGHLEALHELNLEIANESMREIHGFQTR